MRLRLVAPTKRKDSSNLQFEQRIPSDLRERLIGMTLTIPRGRGVVSVTVTEKTRGIRFSLGVSEKGEAKQRQASAIAYLEHIYRALRADTATVLSPKQQMALAADHAKAFLAAHEEDPFSSSAMQSDTLSAPRDDSAAWSAVAHRMSPAKRNAFAKDLKQFLKETDERRRASLAFLLLNQYPDLKPLVSSDLSAMLEETYGADTDAALAAKSLHADAQSRRMVTLEMLAFMGAAHRGLDAMRLGDYSAVRELEVAPRFAASPQTSGKVSLRGLFEDWWGEAARAGKSISAKESFGKAVSTLGVFLGHDDARLVSPGDMQRFKEHMLSVVNPRTGKGLSMKTIGDSYLGGLNVVFKWAVANKRLTANPVEGVKVPKAKPARTRETWFTLDERRAILCQALEAVQGKKEPSERFGGRRWVPWLCAYSGARVGEMVQLRKMDVRLENDHWIMRITPEAGTVKTGQMRDVPLHPHLVEMGFTEFVQAAPDGSLFMWSGEGREAWRTAKNRIREEVRKVVTDPKVQPNHGWRHTFKTIGREAGIQDHVLDAITGHAPRSEGDKYGGATITAKVKAMEAFPKYDTGQLVAGEGER